MTKVNDEFNDAVHAELILKPSRSLTTPGKKLYYGGLLVAGALANYFAIKAGAWPVALVIDAVAAATAGAMVLSDRSGKEYERIRITDSALEIYHYTPGAKAETLRSLSPYMLRVETVLDDFEVCQQLLLKSRGGVTEIGKFLPPSEKLEVARELRIALTRTTMPNHLRPEA